MKHLPFLLAYLPVYTIFYVIPTGSGLAPVTVLASGLFLDSTAGVWTDPYSDAGGGEIWIVIRSVPVRDAIGVSTLMTTDLPVEAPDR